MSQLNQLFRFLCPSRFRPLIAAFLLPLALSAACAQNKGASCKIDAKPASEADLAFYRGDYKAAADLYATAVKATPADGHSREHQVDSLIAAKKLDDALKLVDAWTSSAPTDPYAIVAAGDVQFAQGHWIEAYALMLKALKADPCLASAYQGAAQYESLAGYHATAHKHLTLAHQLEPNDEDIRFDWIETLTPQNRFDQLSLLAQESKSLDEKKKKALQTELNTLHSHIDDHCTLASYNGQAHIPMTPIRLADADVGVQSYGLDVMVNGHKRVLQIDTGASGVTLTHAASGGTGLKPIESIHVGGFGDQQAAGATLMHADSVRIGGLEFANCEVDALSNYGVLGGSRALGHSLDATDGLIGTDIFARYLVTVDYIKHEIRLDPLPQPPSAPPAAQLDPLGGSNDPDAMSPDRYIAPSMKSWTQIYRDGHQLIMPTRINGQTPSLFIVDTGADSNLIDNEAAKKVTRQQTSMNEMEGLSGTQKLGETGKFTLDFAGLRMPVLHMDSADLSSFGAIHGFIGYPTLTQLILHIDYRDNLVLFEAPQGKKM